MKKIFFWILMLIITTPCVYCGYKFYADQNKENKQIICDCSTKACFLEKELATFTLDPTKIQLFLNKKKLSFSKKNYGKGMILKLNLILNKNAMDTLFVKDDRKTIKMYDFVVDTLIVNRKRSIQCDLKQVTIDGKKQFAEDLIIID